MIQDLLYALRLIRKTPVLTCATVLALSVGIGLNGGVFNVMSGIFFHAPVEKDPDTFVRVESVYSGRVAQPGQRGSFTTDDFMAYRTQAHSITNIAAWRDIHVTIENDSVSSLALLTTCEFFTLYGLEQPRMGRLFAGDECAVPNGPPVVLISEEFWHSRYPAETSIIGKAIPFNGTPFIVVGVIPSGFAGRLKGPGIWFPWTLGSQLYGRFLTQQDLFHNNNNAWLNIEGRLKAGVSRHEAHSELALIASRQDALLPGRTTTLFVTNGAPIQNPDERSTVILTLILIMGSLMMVLLIACANVTTLLLSRAVARRGEMAIRLSLGATRPKLMQMLTVEGLVVAGIAGIISTYIASRVPGILRAILPADSPYHPRGMDLPVIGYMLAITFFVGCVIAWAPAAESLRVDLSKALKGDSSQSTSRSGSHKILIVSQVAMSLIMLFLAGTFIRLQHDIHSADPGFETRRVLTVPLSAKGDPEVRRSFYDDFARQVQGLHGVQFTSYATIPPFSGSSTEEVLLPQQTKGSGRIVSVDYVSPDFFRTLGIPILRGRGFEKNDLIGTSSTVVVVSRSFAETFWSNQDPLGKVLQGTRDDQQQVVGVVNDMKSEQYGTTDPPRLYRLQDDKAFGGPLLVRFEGDSRPLAAAIGALVSRMDQSQKAVPHTLRSDMDDLSDRIGLMTGVVIFFAALAVFLAMIGVYAVVAFSMRQRTQELGIRVALGATRPVIFRSVLIWGTKPFVVGMAVGSVIALPGLLILAKLLAGVPEASSMHINALDPVIGGLVLLLMFVIGITAMFVPALEALRLEPIKCLRYE